MFDVVCFSFVVLVCVGCLVLLVFGGYFVALFCLWSVVLLFGLDAGVLFC